MFTIPGKLLRAYVIQKAVQSRSIYSARGWEPPGKLLRAYVIQTALQSRSIYSARRGGASSAMTPPSRLETVTSRGLGP